jgi:hypothetical protein
MKPIKWAVIGYIIGLVASHVYDPVKAFWVGLAVAVVSAAIGG